MTPLGGMVSRGRAGKAVLRVPAGSEALVLTPVAGKEWVALATNRGQLLVLPVSQVPELARGKGNKLINIPRNAAQAGECVVGAVALGEQDRLIVRAGARHLALRRRDLEAYLGERGRRGRKLPRGFQRVDALEAQAPES